LFIAEDGYPLFHGIAVAIDVQPLTGDSNQKAIKVALTVFDLDNDISKKQPKHLLVI